jgi:aerotaxis receptor
MSLAELAPDMPLQTDPNLIDQEVVFQEGELFFSRTDKRGVIMAGNERLRSISGYDWSEMINTPHKLFRHPDMPKALFHILWKGLKENGVPIVAYVKNRTKDGRYYWVLAFAAPVKDGFISVRTKPQTEYFTTIKAEYAKLRQRELAENLDAEQSAQVLNEQLQELGFRSYADFSSQAAAAELLLLSRSNGWVDAGKIRPMNAMNESLKTALSSCQHVADACDLIGLLPTNLEVQASRLGSVAAPIGVIARDSQERTMALKQKMSGFVAALEKAKHSLDAALVRVCVAQVHGAMLRSFVAQEEASPEIDHPQEAKILEARVEGNERERLMRLDEVSAQIKHCSSSLRTIVREVSGLNVTRTMCSIESALLDDNGGTVRTIIEQLGQFQSDIPKTLNTIKTSFEHMDRALKQVMD